MHRVELSFQSNFGESIWESRLVLVAVSGGPDSVACLRAAARLAKDPTRVVAAHFNHRWRGDASNADAEFVRQLCLSLGIKLVEGEAAVETQAKKSEQSARDARYRFLACAAYEVGADYVVTGHTADDRIETMLFNLMRGSGLAGLAAPRHFRPLDDLVLARPLLGVYRWEILDYLGTLNQQYRTDVSNLDQRYARNFIRYKLLPTARQHFSHTLDRQLLSMAELAEEAMLAIETLGAQWLDEASQTSAKLLPVDGLAPRFLLNEPWMAMQNSFRDKPWPVVREGLRQLWLARKWPLGSMSRKHWDRVRGSLLRQELKPRGQAEKTLRYLLTLPGGLHVIALGEWRGFGKISTSR